MKESVYKNYDDLPLFLNATIIAQVLGISAASSYELMHGKKISRVQLQLAKTARRLSKPPIH